MRHGFNIHGPQYLVSRCRPNVFSWWGLGRGLRIDLCGPTLFLVCVHVDKMNIVLL